MKRLLLALKILASIVLVVLLTRRVSLADAAVHLMQVRFLPALAACALLGLSLALSGLRWHCAAGRGIPMHSCLRYTWIAQLYGMILPGALSADVAKGVVMTARRDSSCATALSASIVLDRVAGLGSLFVFGLLSCLARPGLLPISAPGLIVLAGLGSAALVVFPWLIRCLLPRFAIQPRSWFAVLFLSVAIHAVNISFYWISLAAVGGVEGWWPMGIYTCLLNLALMLPVSIAGIGLREQIAISLFQSSGNASVQVAFAWLVLALNLLHALIGLALHLQAGSEKQKADVETAAVMG